MRHPLLIFFLIFATNTAIGKKAVAFGTSGSNFMFYLGVNQVIRDLYPTLEIEYRGSSGGAIIGFWCASGRDMQSGKKFAIKCAEEIGEGLLKVVTFRDAISEAFKGIITDEDVKAVSGRFVLAVTYAPRSMTDFLNPLSDYWRETKRGRYISEWTNKDALRRDICSSSFAFPLTGFHGTSIPSEHLEGVRHLGVDGWFFRSLPLDRRNKHNTLTVWADAKLDEADIGGSPYLHIGEAFKNPTLEDIEFRFALGIIRSIGQIERIREKLGPFEVDPQTLFDSWLSLVEGSFDKIEKIEKIDPKKTKTYDREYLNAITSIAKWTRDHGTTRSKL